MRGQLPLTPLNTFLLLLCSPVGVISSTSPASERNTSSTRFLAMHSSAAKLQDRRREPLSTELRTLKARRVIKASSLVSRQFCISELLHSFAFDSVNAKLRTTR